MKFMDYEYDENENSVTPKGVEWVIADYGTSPESMLDLIDNMLDKFGLEIVQMDGSGGTFCEFSITEKNR
jgi:hypothetical protein